MRCARIVADLGAMRNKGWPIYELPTLGTTARGTCCTVSPMLGFRARAGRIRLCLGRNTREQVGTVRVRIVSGSDLPAGAGCNAAAGGSHRHAAVAWWGGRFASLQSGVHSQPTLCPICQPAQHAMRQSGGRPYRQGAVAWRNRHLAVVGFQLPNKRRQLLQAMPHVGVDVCSLVPRACGRDAAPIVSERLDEGGCIVPAPAKSI